jgi:DNA-directed RNA polymerase subunit RPC12/RpoP
VITRCEKCGKKYQLRQNEKLSDFQCECGGELLSKEVENEPKSAHPKDPQTKTNNAQVIDDKFELKYQLFEYKKKASRIELFVRIIYAIPVGIVLILYGILAGIVLVLQWLRILLSGERNESLNNFIKGYLEYYVHFISYFSIMTDKRPGLNPVKIKLYEVIEDN